jgi:hypothetical protein
MLARATDGEMGALALTALRDISIFRCSSILAHDARSGGPEQPGRSAAAQETFPSQPVS